MSTRWVCKLKLVLLSLSTDGWFVFTSFSHSTSNDFCPRFFSFLLLIPCRRPHFHCLTSWQSKCCFHFTPNQIWRRFVTKLLNVPNNKVSQLHCVVMHQFTFYIVHKTDFFLFSISFLWLQTQKLFISFKAKEPATEASFRLLWCNQAPSTKCIGSLHIVISRRRTHHKYAVIKN